MIFYIVFWTNQPFNNEVMGERQDFSFGNFESKSTDADLSLKVLGFHFPPFVMRKNGSELSGIDIQILDTFKNELNLTVSIELTDDFDQMAQNDSRLSVKFNFQFLFCNSSRL